MTNLVTASGQGGEFSQTTCEFVSAVLAQQGLRCSAEDLRNITAAYILLEKKILSLRELHHNDSDSAIQFCANR
jgi:hypothetical protein